MIPINLTGSDAVIQTLSSETDIIGTASPREIVLFFISLAVAYLLGLIFAQYLKRKMSHRLKQDQLLILTRFVKVILFLLAIAISIPSLLDLSLTIVLICFAGIVAIIGLSSQKVISNMVGGLAILYENPFSTGDFISTGDISGTVISVRIFSVRVRTTSGVYVHIPNDQIYSSTVSNYHANVARRYDYVVGIRYKDNVKKATSVIFNILDQYTFILKKPAPQVFVSDIDTDSVRITFRCWFPSLWADTKDDVSLMTDILPRVKTALESAGIEMPYAHREVMVINPPEPQNVKEQ
jgi:small-conductance mechanosensitive channel